MRLSEQEQDACAKIFEIPESILKKIGDDSQRTLNVARAVLDLALNQGKQTLVFCPSMANAKVLSEYLKINKCKVAAITGDLPKGERRQKLASFKNKEINILTNFGVLTTGFDAPKIDAVVIARPTLSIVLYSQMIGRAIRGEKFGGTAEALILNVADNIVNLPNYRQASVYFNDFFNRGDN